MTPFTTALEDAIRTFESLNAVAPALQQAVVICRTALSNGGKLLICGNGGSAAEAQRLAGELVGRYLHDRAPLPAIALNADSAVLTCIGNDYDYHEVFSRQVLALGRKGDVLVVFTTSGNSPNVLRALETARRMGIDSIAFLGRGGSARELATCALNVPHSATARVQEAHQFLLHCLMDGIETPPLQMTSDSEVRNTP